MGLSKLMERAECLARAGGSGGRRAFTLIELLVVIAIISVLVSLLLPSLAGVRRSAWEVICQNNQRQLGIAVQSYIDDNKQRRFPAISVGAGPPPGSDPERWGGFLYQVGAVGLLQPYLGGDKEPDFKFDSIARFDYEGKNAVKVQAPFNCPAARGVASVRDVANLSGLLNAGRIYATPIQELIANPDAVAVRWSEYWFNDSTKQPIAGSPGKFSGVSGRSVDKLKFPQGVIWLTDALDEFPRHQARSVGNSGDNKLIERSKRTGANNFTFGDLSIRSLTFREYYVLPDRYGASAPFYNWGHTVP